eukprot:TRINITY_DN486_c2_g1_i1.p1 TRINITY_DN486_c2_g1~~TRINITY_DN486_c2_g1_i1.p1  ORF type:complete len:320 (+),score=69.72 TRINITY_DN486_c2_g1_i1:267-1226(+)
MSETKSFEDACELLSRMGDEGKSVGEVMTQSRKHVTSDDTLRERLTTSIAKVKDLGESAKTAAGKLKADYENLVERIERARDQRKEHLVEKRRLQMTLVDAERKVQNSENKLSELRQQLAEIEEVPADTTNDTTDGDVDRLRSEIVVLEKKLISSQANARDNTILESELNIKESQVADLRQQLALSTTESEQKDEKITELQRKAEHLEAELSHALDTAGVDHHDGGSTILSESVRVRPASGPPRLERKTSALAKGRTSVDDNSTGATPRALPPMPTRKLNLQKQKQKASPLSDLSPAVHAAVATLLVVSGFAIGRISKK